MDFVEYIDYIWYHNSTVFGWQLEDRFLKINSYDGQKYYFSTYYKGWNGIHLSESFGWCGKEDVETKKVEVLEYLKNEAAKNKVFFDEFHSIK
ncbi:MAG: hypothetical protein FWC41_03230 [Firmicutes bacterium]|nr:hypothetical protein [Bacillota bacterium]